MQCLAFSLLFAYSSVCMEIEIVRLNLLSPLYYIPEKDSEPFDYREGDGEMLFYFELDEAQALELEPDKTKFLGKQLFGGKAAETARDAGEELPQGLYLFAQKREILGRKEILDMAVEIHQEGLWQRLLMGKKLYLRYLFEDGCSVTQLFRPHK